MKKLDEILKLISFFIPREKNGIGKHPMEFIMAISILNTWMVFQ